MKFPTIRYLRPAKAQTSLRIQCGILTSVDSEAVNYSPAECPNGILEISLALCSGLPQPTRLASSVMTKPGLRLFTRI